MAMAYFPQKQKQSKIQMTSIVKLTSSDNQEFSVAEEIIFQSTLIKNMVGDLDVGQVEAPNSFFNFFSL